MEKKKLTRQFKVAVKHGDGDVCRHQKWAISLIYSRNIFISILYDSQVHTCELCSR